ncbi:MAG: type VI secretion protein IcmF/TssM N-terminal domain-containing protein [Desulfosarcinaceae bacterium]
MKQLLGKIFKILLVITLLGLAVLMVFGLALLLGWPWWVGFFLLVGLVGILVGVMVLRKMFVRRREQNFVHQIIEQDESIRQHMAAKDQDTARELQGRWKEAIDALRRSHLRKFGNPLYVLPWYMVIGESGSGKTTAIQSARLSSPFAEVSRTSGISGTRNCDWWFFEQAILIDTAGRYAIPVDEGRDKDEWQKFLTLLAKFRKREPLNGLVVTVAADRLAQNKPEALQEDGRSIRRRVEELMRVLGAKFPIYVLVTKCDLIQGATQFCDSLPEPALEQAMGELNQRLNANVKALSTKVFRTVGDRLRDLRLMLLHKIKDQKTASSMLLFPEELEKLMEPLLAFLEGAFQENPYMETPLLRGIFFSSGRQEGAPFSHFLSALGLIQGREVLAGTSKGLFLHDFFARILPADRHLFRPTQHMRQWQQITRNLGLTAWIAVMVAVCGLLSYAFVKNLSALSDVRREFQKPAVMQGEITADTITLERFREALVKAQEQNRQWWIPRMGLNESLRVETALKQKYISLYQSGFLDSFDKAMAERMTHFSAETPNPVFGAHVAYLVRRINLLKGRLAKEDLAQLSALPQPKYNGALFNRGELIPEIQEKISLQNLYAIAWQTKTEPLNDELKNLQTWLKHLLTLPGVTLNWLVDWVDSDGDLAAVGLQDFWGGDSTGEKTLVPAAFTQSGKEKIDALLTEIEAALFDPLIIAGQKVEFIKWYQAAYFKSWQTFAQQFDQGRSLLTKREQWQTVAKRLPTENGPYYALIDRVLSEFAAFGKDVQVPAWVGLAYDWQGIQTTSKETKPADLENAGLIRKATRKVKSKIKRAERAFGVRVRAPLKAEDELEAAKAQQAYQQALEETVKAADSRNVAFKMASDLYQQDTATGESPVLVAQRSLDQMRSILADAQNEEEKPFWALLEGNLTFMQSYLTREASCSLQDRWEKDVLMELQGISADRDMAQVMMGQGGYAEQFIKGPAAPFISKSLAKGYYAKRILGQEVGFDKDFLSYLTKGARAARPTQSSYKVRIRAYRTDST